MICLIMMLINFLLMFIKLINYAKDLKNSAFIAEEYASQWKEKHRQLWKGLSNLIDL